MSRIKKLFKYLLVFCVLVIVAVAGIYCISWYFVARNMQDHIDVFWAELPIQNNFKIEGEKPVVTGFPFPPEVIFSGMISGKIPLNEGISPDVIFNIPELKLVGFPLPGLTLYLEAAKGIDVSERYSGNGINIDYALLNFTLPTQIPETMIYNDIKEWQKLDDSLIFNHVFFKSGDVSINGNGYAGLNSDLDLNIRIETRVKGMEALFNRLAENSKIKQKDLAIAQNFLKMIASTDPETGESYFDTGFFIQNNGIFIGPMRIGQIPPINWDGSPNKTKDLSRKSLGSE